MEALALAVATAVIQYLVDKTDLLENVRGWLKRDPASLAYQRALLRAYAAFARSDPALAKSFFDETFLARAAVPELAKQLTRHEHANSAELARLWAASLYGDAFAEKRAQWAIEPRVVQACAQFLQWLENELKREEVFQPLVDSRALEALEAKFDELARVLTNERNEALRRAETYEPVINQIARQTSVNISDHSNVVVYGDLVGGDKIVHNYFYGNFTSLDDYYIAPDSVYQRVKIDEFVGREWLVSRLDAFLNDASRVSGVFRIEGEAGIGKTSFLAHLVRERGYLHLFAEQVPGDNNVERALLSLGAQIVSRYCLDPYAERNTLPAIAGFSDFLYKLLNMASQRLAAGEKIIVVCDALDEAGNGANGNVFGLPTTLPDNVYFILSQRPVSVRLNVKCEIHHERVNPENANNLHDMGAYLHGMAARPQIAQQLRARNYPAAEFVRVLTDKSGGVWMYLQYVLDEIQRGARHPLELDKLPNGLVGFYLAYWGDWRAGRNPRGKGESEWYALYLPLLTTLSVAQEPISLDTLIAWTGVNVTQYQVRNLLREQWRAFIAESEVQGASLFTLYHASLRDFLTGKVDTNALPSADCNFIDELRDGTQAAHKRIVANFTEQCRGNWTDLIPDDYARRYLTLHLEGAEQYDTMRELVAWSDAWAKARYEQGESWNGYLTDLERVWAFAEQKENLGWQVRCALIYSSLVSQSGKMPPALLSALVTARIWHPTQALTSASLIQSPHQRTMVIMGIVEFLCEQGKSKEAVLAIRELPDEHSMLRAVQTLAGSMSSELTPLVYEFQEEKNKLSALEAIIPHTKPKSRQDILKIIQSFGQDKNIGSALALSCEYLLPDAAQAVLELIGRIKNTGEQVKLFRIIGSFLSQELLSLALETARSKENWADYTQVAIALIPFLQGTLKSQIQIEALFWCKMSGTRYIVPSLSVADLARTLPPESRQDIFIWIFGDIVEFVRNTKDGLYRLDRAFTLMDFGPYLGAEYRTLAVKTAYEVVRKFEYRRIADVKPLVLELVGLEMYSEAMEILLASENGLHFIEPEAGRVLELIVGRLPKDILSELLRNQNEDVIDIASHSLSLEQTLEELSADIPNDRWISDERHKDLLIHLAELGHADLAVEKLLAVWEPLFEHQMADVSIAILPFASESGIQKIFEKAIQIELSYAQRAGILEAIVPYLLAPLLEEAIQQSWTIFDDAWRVAAVKRLIHLGYEQEAFASLMTLFHTRIIEIDSTLGAVASEFSTALLGEITASALKYAQWKLIVSMTHALPDSMLSQCFEKIEKLSYEKRLAVIEEMVPKLSGQNLLRALEIVSHVDEVSARDTTLANLVKTLPSNRLEEILLLLPIRGSKFRRLRKSERNRHSLTVQTLIKLAHQIRDEDIELQTLAKLSEFLSKEWQEKTLFYAAKQKSQYSLVPLLVNLGKYLDAAKILEESGDVQGLLDLAQRVPLTVKTEILLAARRAAVRGNSDDERESNLIAIAQVYIGLNMPVEAYTTINATSDYIDWAEAFATIAPQLLPLCSQEFMGQILHDLDETTVEWPRLMVLASLAPYLNSERRDRILPEIKAKMNRFFYSTAFENITGLEIRVLAGVALYSGSIQRFMVRLWKELLPRVKQKLFSVWPGYGLSLEEFCLLLPDEFLEETIVIANGSRAATPRALLLSSLYPRLAEEQRPRFDVELETYYNEILQEPEVRTLEQICENLFEIWPSRRTEMSEKVLDAIYSFITVAPADWSKHYFWESQRKALLAASALDNLLRLCLQNGGSASVATKFISLFLSEPLRNEADTISFCAALVPFCPMDEQRSLLTKLFMRCGTIEKRVDRERALRDVVAQVNRENCPDIRKIFFVPVDWQDRDRVRRSRSELLSELMILLPVIHSELGESGIMELYNAILEVCEWWS